MSTSIARDRAAGLIVSESARATRLVARDRVPVPLCRGTRGRSARMIAREPSAYGDREAAREAVQDWLLRLETAVRLREPLQGQLLGEYARRVARLRAAEA